VAETCTSVVLDLIQAEFLRSRGGIALLVTHRDYLADQPVLAACAKCLKRFAHDDRARKALPGEVRGWWRRRYKSHLKRARHA
jgi:hypothetical protein